MYKAFQAQNPDITIDFQIIPWEQARPKMLTLAQGDSLPDMGRMSWPDDYAAAQMVVPIDGIGRPRRALTRFDTAGLDQFSAEGSDGKKHLYGLPWFAGDAAILVNKTLFDKAGLTLKDSWTTDEFTQYAKTLTQAGQQWGVALDVAGIGDPVQNLLLAVYAYGGKWVKGDTSSTTPEPLVFNSPETVAGITWYAGLFKNGYAVPSAPTDTYKERDANFQSGKAAMEWQGPWSLLEIQDNFKKGGYELASMPLPQGSGRERQLARRRGRRHLRGGAEAQCGRRGAQVDHLPVERRRREAVLQDEWHDPGFEGCPAGSVLVAKQPVQWVPQLVRQHSADGADLGDRHQLHPRRHRSAAVPGRAEWQPERGGYGQAGPGPGHCWTEQERCGGSQLRARALAESEAEHGGWGGAWQWPVALHVRDAPTAAAALWREVSRQRMAYVFLLPALLVLAVRRLHSDGPGRRHKFVGLQHVSPGVRPFVGVRQYADLLNDDIFVRAFWQSWYFTLGSVACQFICRSHRGGPAQPVRPLSRLLSRHRAHPVGRPELARGDDVRPAVHQHRPREHACCTTSG